VLLHVHTREGNIAAFLLFSLTVALITFFATGAVARVRTKEWQFGGSAAMFIATFELLLRSIPTPVLLSGVVFGEDGNTPAKNPVVTIRGGSVYQPVEGQSDGYYAYSVPAELVNQRATIRAKADGFGPSDPKIVRISPTMEPVDFVLKDRLRNAELELKSSPAPAQNTVGSTLEPWLGGAMSEYQASRTKSAVDVSYTFDRSRSNQTHFWQPAQHEEATTQSGAESASKPGPNSAVNANTPAAPTTGVTSSPPAHLPNSVTAFYFNYVFEPKGTRNWSENSNGSWYEKYPDGSQTLFLPDGRATIDGNSGIVVMAANNPSFKVFIPDKHSPLMWTRFRSGTDPWAYLAEMLDVR
jgi:hypothetical protein